MRTISLLSLLLAGPLPVVLASALASAPAHAQQVTLAQPVVDLVPTGEVVGDGQTSATLYVVGLGLDGEPLSELGRISAAEGEIGKLEAVSPGLFRASWTPPSVNQARTIEITIKGKVTGHGAVTTKVPVPVVPSTAHAVGITSNPATVVLGQDTSATVTIRLSGGASATLDGADLAVRASSGTVANVTPLGRGQYSLLYTPPSNKLFPHLALLTVADRRDPTGTTGGIALPLSGKAPFNVSGLPGSSILVRVGDKEFGPVQADAQGKASISLVVPPGTDKATVISVLGDQRQESPLDLKVPTTQRVQLFPLAPAVGADGSSSTTVRAMAVQGTGQPDASATVSFTSDTGSFGAVRNEGGGVYAADWVPDDRDKAGTAKVTVKIADPAGDQTDQVEVRLLPGAPDGLTLTTDPTDLAGNPQRVEAQARVSGSASGVSFGVAGGTTVGSTEDRGDGLYAQKVTVAGARQLAIQAAATADASSNPLARVLVFPSAELVTNDGTSQVVVTVLTVDAQGYPVGNAPVALSLVQGDGTVGTSVTTDARGIAHSSFTAGTVPGLVSIQAATGGHIGGAGILQLPAGATAIDLPDGGDPLGSALTSRWNALVEGLSLAGEGAPPVAAALPTGAPVPLAGAIAGLTLSTSAASVPPGGTLQLTVEAKDEQGRSAAGRTLQVYTNAGTVEPLTDLKDGRYTTRMVAPASGTEVIRLTVVSPESGVSSMVEVPVSADGSAWGVVAEDGPPESSEVRDAPVMPVTNPDPAPESTATVEPQPSADVDRPWLRVTGGILGGFYSYRQVPFTSRGALYGDRITFGNGTTPAAQSIGLGLKARAWSPGLEYFGAQAAFRATAYGVQLADFGDEVINDWVTDTEVLLMARYPVNMDATRLHVGARAGLGLGDFMVYRQDTTGDTPVLDYGPLVVPSFNAGGELGLDWDGTVVAVAGSTLGFNGGGGLYSVGIDGQVGYAISDLLLYVNGGWMQRTTNVYVDSDGEGNQKAGELYDAFTMFGGGVGYQF